MALITLNQWHILNAMDYYSLNIRFPHNNLIPSFGKEANLGTWTFQNRKKGYLLSNADFLFLRILKLWSFFVLFLYQSLMVKFLNQRERWKSCQDKFLSSKNLWCFPHKVYLSLTYKCHSLILSTIFPMRIWVCLINSN